jgi:predicted lactoylglutathione lyase
MEMDLGRLFICLDVSDVRQSMEFYKNIGFEPISGDPDIGWVIVENGQHRIGLFKGQRGILLNFLEGSVDRILKYFKENGVYIDPNSIIETRNNRSATLEDPDGNLITFSGYYENWVKVLKCPRCKNKAEHNGKKFYFGPFNGRGYYCERCGRSFNAFYRNEKLSHTVPRSSK